MRHEFILQIRESNVIKFRDRFTKTKQFHYHKGRDIRKRTLGHVRHLAMIQVSCPDVTALTARILGVHVRGTFSGVSALTV